MRGEVEYSQPSAAAVARAWDVATALVVTWPDLSVSSADWYDGPDHLIVRPDSGGPTLHFDRDDGPLLETDQGDVSLRWCDVEDLNPCSALGRVEWISIWGQPSPTDQLSAKAAVYATIAAALEPSEGVQWSARPAKVVFDTEQPADDPQAVFRLLGRFPSLMSTVQWYATKVSRNLRRAASAGAPPWHEPLWQLSGNGEPMAVLDEAGRLHLPRISSSDDNLADLLELVGEDADWVAGGFSFDVLEALIRLQGDVGALVELIRPGARYALGPRRAWSPGDPSRPMPLPRRAES